MNLITRSLLLLCLLFAARIIHSCTCPDNHQYFDFDLLTVANLENSQDYVRTNPTDTMYSASVAFELSITGSSVFAQNAKSKLAFGFSEATATEPCALRFIPNQQISNITIRTLAALSPDIPVNTDVTDLFLGLIPYNSSSGYMYEPINDLLTKINQQSLFDDPTSTFQLFCKVNIQNQNAQFEFIVDLSDGRTLTSVTNPIHLKPSF